MNLKTLSSAAYETCHRFAQDAKIILLHPSSRYRSVIVARLLADPQYATLYYALDHDDASLPNFLRGLMNGLALQHPTLGRRLSLLPETVFKRPDKRMDAVLRVLLDELGELTDGEFFLVLDEFDRAEMADDVLRFVERLSQLAPQRMKIVLNGRLLPRLPWLSMIARRHAVILRDSQILRQDIYEKRKSDGARFKALAIGPGYVFRDDYLVEGWEGHLPLLLLFYALDRPAVTRNDICATFWPKLHIHQAVNVFHVTKRRLHKALGLDILLHDGRYYRANPRIPHYFDAIDFVEKLLEGRYGEPQDSFELWQELAKLYRGPFLQGHKEPWIIERRAAYRIAYLEALENIADLWAAQERDELALHTLTRAVETDYSREGIHRKLLRLYARLGRRAEAVAHYRELERWTKNNKKKLSGETRQLFSDIIA